MKIAASLQPDGSTTVDRDTTLTNLADHVGDLVDERHHVERVPFWDTNRNRKVREVRTVQPGLLDQLHAAAQTPVRGLTDPGPRRVPSSRPPLALEALSTFHQVEHGAARWCMSLHQAIRPTAAGNLRALVGQAPALDDDTLTTLADEIRAWWRWASVATGWTTPPYQPHVPCPACDRTGKLRINLDAQVATCRECRVTWAADDGSIFVLGEYVRSVTGQRVA